MAMELQRERISDVDPAVGQTAQPDEGGVAKYDVAAKPNTQFAAARTSTPDLGDVERSSSSIADATISCRQSLTQCLAVQSLKDDWAEDRLADFKLWDAGVGASSNRKSSLEERLALKPHVRDVVMNLLMVLKITVDQCREFGLKVDQLAKITPDASQDQPKEDSRGESLSVASQVEADDDSAQRGVDEHSAKFVEAVQTADTLLNDLARLGVVIRKAAIKSHIEKADGGFRLDIADLQALKKHLTRIVLFRPQHLENRRDVFWHGPGVSFFDMSTPEQYDCLSHFGLDVGKALDVDEMTKAQDHLITANLRRNHRFRYSQRHALKLEKSQSFPARNIVQAKANTSGATTETVLNDDFAMGSASSLPTTKSSTSMVLPENVSSQSNDQHGSDLSDTTASAINTESMDARTTSVTTSEKSGTGSSAITSRIKTHYPRPPNLKERAINFKCPCCCAPLERKDHAMRQWRKHLNRDLQPYTCILNNCVTPNALFSEKDQWLQHMTDHHSHHTFYWECPFCEDSVQIGSQEMFTNHIMEKHSRAAREIQFPSFLEVCAKPKILDGMSCPLCSVGQIDGDESEELLLDHIAEHIHSFALSSLPLLYSDKEQKEDDKKEEQPEMNGYFKDHPYFAESDENSSRASQGTILDSEDADNQMSLVNASLEPADEDEPHASPVEPTNALERSETTDDDSRMLAFKNLRTDKRSLAERLDEKQSNITFWRSSLVDMEVVDDESSSQSDDETLPIGETIIIRSSQERTLDDWSDEENHSQSEDLTPMNTKESPRDEEKDNDEEKGNDEEMGNDEETDNEEEEDDDEDDDDEGSKYEDLPGSLRAEMMQSVFDRRQFLPRGALDRLVTGQSVRVAMDTDQPAGHDTMLEEYIMGNARAVFAIAVYIRLPRLREALRLFLENDFGDANLPIDKWSRESIKSKSKNHPFVSMERSSRRAANRIWTWSRIYDFQEEQWKFIAPVISTSVATYDMGERILPFIKKHTSHREGSFAVVSKYEIHKDHFEDPLKMGGTNDKCVLAVKAMKAEDSKTSFKRWTSEVQALKKMNSLHQNHIVRFLGAFHRGKPENLEYYLTFEWAAGGDLRDLWEATPQPILTASLTKEVMNQLVGLAEALRAAHYLLDDDGTYHGASYRHGDLKPHNILWFPDRDGFGTLKIGDWSEAKEHNVDTQMRYATTAVYGTRRYEPPEVVTGTHADALSRLYDMWSIGCIFFELLVWLLYGLDELKRFSRLENQESAYSSPFFEIELAQGKKTARVHSAVTNWMERMAQDPACQIGITALGDLLEIIQTGLLVVKLPKAGGSVNNPREIFSTHQRPASNEPGGEKSSGTLGVQNLPSITLTSTDETAENLESFLEPPGRARFRAFELCDRITSIIYTDQDESYWFTDRSLRLTAAIPRSGQTRTVTKLPRQSENLAYEDIDSVHTSAYRREPGIDYSHPKRISGDWEFEVDNTFASDVFSSSRGDIEWSVRMACSLATNLCGKCTEFQKRIYLPWFSITYTTQEINANTKAESCDLCSLLRKACLRYDDMARPTIKFEKVGSILEMDGTGPVLSLFRSYESSSHASVIQMGFANLSRPDSALRLDILRNWLRDCNDKHVNPMCKRNDHKSSKSISAASAAFPSRLLDLADPGNGVIRLIDSTVSALDAIEWVALDYRWGPGPQFTTTQANLDQHLTGINMNSLPATFVDAILVTHALGVRYLWIDSICIIQDDPGAVQEIESMGDIYSNACCVLAASSATSSSSGFLTSRIERDSVAFQSDIEEDTAFYVCEFIDNFEDHALKSPLARRAWSLQAHALARRTIFFTDHQAYWECGHGVRCETMTKMKSNSAALLGDPDFPQILETYSSSERLQRVQDLYRHYSRLGLSHATDTPFAIASLEKRLIRTMKVRGGFGILDDTKSTSVLCRSLLWKRGVDVSSLRRIAFQSDRARPPSWSWMAYQGAIDYLHTSYDKCDWQDIESPWSRFTLGDSDNILTANARGYSGWGFTASPGESIIFDIPFPDPEKDKDNISCVVVGIEKGSGRHYVIFVILTPGHASDGSPLWERIGVGCVSGTKLGREIGKVHVA